MSAEVHVRIEGRAGRITLDRPEALNALTWDMCLAIEKALDDWRLHGDVHVLLIDGAPGRAFCAGGDIVAMHRAGIEERWEYGQRFWSDEYRMNLKLHAYPKPIATFLHGFTMGGGVGVGCHGSHRIVNDSSRIAMPECAIGLVPDVGGSMLLARAPGRLGRYLAVTGARMGAGDAIEAGFADHYVPEGWEALAAALCETGNISAVEAAAYPAPDGPLGGAAAEIDTLFAGETLAEIVCALDAGDTPFAETARAAIALGSPLAMASTVEILRRLGPAPTMHEALAQEARFTFRAAEHGDFIEGIRAQVIDRDRLPRWLHDSARAVPPEDVERMLTPLGPLAPDLETET